MKQSYTVKGMTCNGCVASVTNRLSALDGVEEVTVSLADQEAQINMVKPIANKTLQDALPAKFLIEEKHVGLNTNPVSHVQKTKLQQLKPLLLIFLYLFTASFLLNFKDWNTGEAMLDFMGLFYIVFSFFKLLDLKGFPESFKMYDPLAKVLPVYGWLYPFIELGLGLLFLLRVEIEVALIVTIIILGITTIGVTKSLLNKKSIRCACLGTALKLPMTEATFIENAIMLIMAFWMLSIM